MTSAAFTRFAAATDAKVLRDAASALRRHYRGSLIARVICSFLEATARQLEEEPDGHD